MVHLFTIYTDGSCHTQHCIGSWVAIILNGNEKIVLSGIEEHTTHQRMELLAVIKGIEYITGISSGSAAIKIITDSQYVSGLPSRREKLMEKYVDSSKDSTAQNIDLVYQLFSLLNNYPAEFIKIKAHQKNSGDENYNREADMLSRKLVRDKCR